jgi:hypothetical protein
MPRLTPVPLLESKAGMALADQLASDNRKTAIVARIVYAGKHAHPPGSRVQLLITYYYKQLKQQELHHL